MELALVEDHSIFRLGNLLKKMPNLALDLTGRCSWGRGIRAFKREVPNLSRKDVIRLYNAITHSSK